jgi:hypothetical protein
MEAKADFDDISSAFQLPLHGDDPYMAFRHDASVQI